ncbi:hypothetical protein ACFVZM_12520 [Streptomyces sioyaensis]|uniref:hypothetical protein n=1 Tax=Streptomyces sioyaensis TaxID=67364 RepID=UPI00368B1FDA
MSNEANGMDEGRHDAGRETPTGQTTEGPIESDEVLERREWFYASRSDAEGKVLRDTYARAAARRKHLELRQAELPPASPGGPGSVNWTPIGPSVVALGQATNNPPVSGRVTAITAGPNSSRVYVGAANGGVWFSSDAGATWAPLDDYVASPTPASGAEADSLSVGAMAVRFGASTATDVVYVGTGEGSAGDAYFGIGIRRSPAGGAPGTWTLEGSNLAGRAVYAMTIDPDNPALVLAATSNGIYRRPASGSMTSWTQVTSPAFTNASGTVTSLIVAGTGTNKTYYAAFLGDRVYSSADAATWTALTGISGGGRVALAAGESDPTAVYAVRQDGNLYRLVGTAFQAVTGLPGNVLFASGQGWYDIAIGVDPANASRIYLAGDVTWDGNWSLSFWRGTVTGGPGSWTFPFNPANAGNPSADPTWIGRNVHADAHAFCFGLNGSGTAHDPSSVWIGTDGGLWHSSMNGDNGTFRPRNTGLAITENTFLAQRADSDAVVFAGTQDNGTVRYLGEEAWVERPQGDGGGLAVDPNNPYQVMRQYVRAGLWYSDDGGASYSAFKFPPRTSETSAQINAAKTESDASGFYGPIATTPSGIAPTLAAYGTNRLWVTENWGTGWVTLPTGTNPYVPTTPDAAQDVIDGNPITAIAFASATRVYAATFRTIWRYDKSGATWARTALPTTGLPAFVYITDMAVEDGPAGRLYIALGGGGNAHCWYFDGTTWSAALPTSVIDAPAHAVAVDPDHPEKVYVGTDVGCWRGQRAGTNWTWDLYSQGLPESAITDLAVHQASRLLRAATHGRGVWEIPLDATSGTDPDVYMRANYADNGRIVGGSRLPLIASGAPDPTNRGFNAYIWMSADIKVRRPSLPGLPSLGSPVDYLDFAVNIGDYAESSTNVLTADSTGYNRMFVEVHNRGLTPVPGSQVQVLLLLTDASAGVAALPSNYAAHINSGDTSNWLAGTSWHFADPATPYRRLTGTLDVRTPQVVEFDVDLSTLGLPTGHDHVCTAAFVTAGASDQITATAPDLGSAVMQDKHICWRNLHLVTAGAKPVEGGQYRHDPVTFLIDFHNAQRRDTVVDLVVDRSHFPGQVSMMLPKLSLENRETACQGFAMQEHRRTDGAVGKLFGKLLVEAGELMEAFGGYFERSADPLARINEYESHRRRRLSKLVTLDTSRIYVADAAATTPSITGVRIPAGGAVTAAITVQAPPPSRPGDRYTLDVIQRLRHDGALVGGSSYVIAVTKPAPAGEPKAPVRRRGALSP